MASGTEGVAGPCTPASMIMELRDVRRHAVWTPLSAGASDGAALSTHQLADRGDWTATRNSLSGGVMAQVKYGLMD